jgi:hypothetical protein
VWDRPVALSGSGTTSIRPLAIYRDTLRSYVRLAPVLLLVGAIVFLPVGLLEASVARIGAIAGATDNGFTIGALLALALIQVVLGLLGEVFYSGVVATLIAVRPPVGGFTLGWVARRLSYGRLVAIDLIYGLAVAAGLLLLIVPGVLALTWLSLAAPLVEIEGCGVRAALRRSRELVRGRFWSVLAVVLPLSIAIQAASDGILALGHDLLGGGFVAEWLADTAGNVLLSPFYALPVVLITVRLIGQPRQPSGAQV